MTHTCRVKWLLITEYKCSDTDITNDINIHYSATDNISIYIHTHTQEYKPTLGHREQALSRSLAKSAPASSMVLLDVRLLLGAMTRTASGVRGTAACSNSVLSSIAQAPGVHMRPKESEPSGIGTKPSTIARRWESPTTRTNWKKRLDCCRMKITNKLFYTFIVIFYYYVTFLSGDSDGKTSLC